MRIVIFLLLLCVAISGIVYSIRTNTLSLNVMVTNRSDRDLTGYLFYDLRHRSIRSIRIPRLQSGKSHQIRIADLSSNSIFLQVQDEKGRVSSQTRHISGDMIRKGISIDFHSEQFTE